MQHRMPLVQYLSGVFWTTGFCQWRHKTREHCPNSPKHGGGGPQQATKPSPSHLLLHSQVGEENWKGNKQEKLKSQHKDSSLLIKKEKKNNNPNKQKTQTKQITPHRWQWYKCSRPMPNQSPSNSYFGEIHPSPPPQTLPQFTAEHDIIGHGISPWLAVPAVSPLQCLTHPQPIPGGKWWWGGAGQGGTRNRRVWCCASMVQQQKNHWCVTKTVLVTNPKHSTIPAVTKNTNSIPARPSTVRHLLLY